MPYFGQELLLAARDGGGAGSPQHVAASRTTEEARSALAALMREHDLDALIAPTNGPAWRIDYARGDGFGVSSSSIASVTGYPSMTVPVALAGELPLGVSLIGKPGEESLLFALGVAIEQARGPFPEPRFLPSSD
jgi:amidase